MEHRRLSQCSADAATYLGSADGDVACVLRVAGRDFDVDAYLRRGRLDPVAVYRRGEPKFKTKPRGAKVRCSGCNILVSDRDFSDFPGQLREAVAFLKRNGSAVRALRRRPGVEQASLDFGVERRPTAIVETDRFPEELIRLAGTLGLALALSRYPPSPREPRAANQRMRPRRRTTR
jgi:hypothetical protein